MLKIFPAVFESVWKRKETKIYLSFAFIFLAVYFVSTFIPNTKFLQPYSSDGSKECFTSLWSSLYNINDIFPLLALVYLTYTVFRHEVDNHIFFMYKDLKRGQIIWAKLFSLFAILGIYFLLFTGFSLFVYYIRIAHLPFASMNFMDPETKWLWSQLFIVLPSIGMSLFYICLTAFASMYLRIGAVMITGLVSFLVVSILTAVESPIVLVLPKGLDSLTNLQLAYPLLILMVIAYVLILGQLVVRKFDKIEF